MTSHPLRPLALWHAANTRLLAAKGVGNLCHVASTILNDHAPITALWIAVADRRKPLRIMANIGTSAPFHRGNVLEPEPQSALAAAMHSDQPTFAKSAHVARDDAGASHIPLPTPAPLHGVFPIATAQSCHGAAYLALTRPLAAEEVQSLQHFFATLAVRLHATRAKVGPPAPPRLRRHIRLPKRHVCADFSLRDFCVHTRLGVLVVDAAGVILSLNSAAERLLGDSKHHLLGRTCCDARWQILREDGSFLPISEHPALRAGRDAQAVHDVVMGIRIASIDTIRWVRVSALPHFSSHSTTAHRVLLTLDDISAQRAAQEKLTEQLQHHRTLLDNLPGMAYRSSNHPDWPMDFVSRGCRELTGYPTDALTQHPTISFASIIHPDDRRRVWAAVQEAAIRARPFVIEYRLCTAAGEWKWVWEKGVAIVGPDKNITGIEGFITDITERKHFEHDLTGQAKRLECFRHMAEIFSQTTTAFHDQVAAFLPHLAEAFSGSASVHVCVSIGHERIHSPHWRATATRTQAEIKNGHHSVGLIEVYRDHDTDDGSAEGTFSPAETFWLHMVASRLADFHALSLLNQALRESESRARAIIQHLPLPTYIFSRRNTAFVLTDFNATAASFTLIRGLFQQTQNLIEPAGLLESQVSSCLNEAWEEGTATVEFTVNTGADQNQRRVAVTCVRVPADTLLLHATDITEISQREEQRYYRHKMEAIGRLAGGIAHDFNNLLTIIINYANFVLDSPIAPSTESDVVEIRNAAEQAAVLTKQLLAFGRRQGLVLRPLQLNTLIREALPALQKEAGTKIEVCTGLDTDLSEILADTDQIYEVLFNLIANARDAMPNGGRISVYTKHTHLQEPLRTVHGTVPPGSYVSLKVVDTGKGIAPELIPNVFEPFFSTHTAQRGAGMGLATTYGFIQQCGGHIWLESAPDLGTFVHLLFPPRPANAAISSSAVAAPEQVDGQTILFVEDDSAIRVLGARALSARGYRVLLAANGVEALDLALQHPGPIHLLITDMVMPYMGGLEVAKRLSASRPAIQVLFISGYTEQSLNQDEWPPEDCHFLAKPFSVRELGNRAREILGASTPLGR